MLENHYGKDDLLILAMDHYYRDFSPLSTEARNAVNFDHPDAFDWELLANHVEMLKKGESISRPTYDFKTHTRSSTSVFTAPKKAIVVEGILSLHDSKVRSLFDLSVFVDVCDDLRFIRRLRRDIKERGRSMDSVIDQYLDTVRPMHTQFIEPQRAVADIIIGWRDISDKAVKMLAKSLS